MKTKIGIISNLAFLALFSSFSAKSQDVSLSIMLSDTLGWEDNRSPYRLQLNITNHTNNTLYIPNYRVSRPEFPDNFNLSKYYKNLQNCSEKHNTNKLDTILLNDRITSCGLLFLVVRNAENDSLVDRYCYTYEYLKYEIEAAYDTTLSANPLQIIDPSYLFAYQRMLKLSPHSTHESWLLFDFNCYDLKPDKKYRFFLIYSINRELLHKLQPFGVTTDKLNILDNSIKSNELNLKFYE